MVKARARVSFLVIALLAVWNGGPSRAQDYPQRQVTIVVPFGAGGSVDIVGRMIAQKLSERLGKPFIVENRPGAGTATATLAVSKSPPDGHTLLLAPSGTYAINPTLYKQLAYDPIKDLSHVALITHDPLVLVVNPSLPVNSVADLVKLAKEQPGKLSFAGTGPGTSLTLLGELLKTTAQIDIVQVGYRGGAQALQDVIAGQVHMMFSDPASGIVQAKAGKVRALGVSSAQRLAAAPEIPTVAEAGLPGFAIQSWEIVAAPAGTPAAIVNKLNAELKAIMALPDIRATLDARGQVAVVSPPPETLADFIRSEQKRWGDIVRKAGLAGTL
jgi:tripartite-type tricarboxylate transporter receptor subunit TctC